MYEYVFRLFWYQIDKFSSFGRKHIYSSWNKYPQIADALKYVSQNYYNPIY